MTGVRDCVVVLVRAAAAAGPKPRPRVSERLAMLYGGPLRDAFMSQHLLPQFDTQQALLPAAALAAAAEAHLEAHQGVLEVRRCA